MATFHCPHEHAHLTDDGVTEDDKKRGAAYTCPECGRLFDEHGRELGTVFAPPVVSAPAVNIPAAPPPVKEKKPRAKKMSAEERKKRRLQERLRLEEKHNPYFAGR